MKKYLLIIIILFLSLKNVYALDNNIKIYDYALVFNDKQEEKLNREIDRFTNKVDTDLILITVRHTSLNDSKEYLNAFYNKYINKDSILLVMELNNNNVKLDMQVYGAKKNLYSDEQMNKILNNVKINDSYYKTVINFIDEVEQSDKYLGTYNKYTDIKYWILILFPSMVLSSIVTFIKLLKNKVENVKEENIYLKLDSFMVDKKIDKFLTTHTNKNRIR